MSDSNFTPYPDGGFNTDEAEARWLADRIVYRFNEALRASGANARITENALDQLILLSMKSAAKRNTKELQDLFDLRLSADQRAIKRWQSAGPNREKTWPDHADLVVWLLEQLPRREVRNE